MPSQAGQPSLPWHPGSPGGGPHLPKAAPDLLFNPPVSEDHTTQNVGGGTTLNFHNRDPVHPRNTP